MLILHSSDRYQVVMLEFANDKTNNQKYMWFLMSLDSFKQESGALETWNESIPDI